MSENLLRHEVSPYLLQHRDNPVHWRPWGPAALAEARAAGKPILLSVGYAACHWCHVMAHESFEDPATAAVMNRLFVNIKVDREERPDIDQIYMNALHALGEQGGWPLTMFLTPDGEPIWGGTYFPNTARYGRPAFTAILEEVARVFRDEPATVAQNRAAILERIRTPPVGEGAAMTRDLLDRASERLLGLIDPRHGGIGGAPKFPQAGLLELLWRADERSPDPRYRDAVLLTLRAICQGGIYDHLAGGFARYSTDERWLAPHFEKMLYDNGQLLELLTSAWTLTGEPLFQARIEETVAWLLAEMRQPGGAFAASIDADSEGHEGRFYVWTRDQILSVLGQEEGAFFAGAYDVTPAGNWEGTSILNRIGKAFPDPSMEERLAAARRRLLAARGLRVRPATDDKILADWNGLTIGPLATAGAALDRPEWIEAARAAYRFIAGRMGEGDRFAHAVREGKRVFPGLATDHAAMVKAALDLYAATFDADYLADAERWAAALRAHYYDRDRPGYFLSADDAEALIVRPRSDHDEATPSATGLMARNLVRLWRLTGKDAYRADADAVIEAAGVTVAENLFASVGVLSALDFRLNATDIVIAAASVEDAAPLLATARRSGGLSAIIALHPDLAGLPSAHPAYGKTTIAGRPTAYVCRGETCSLPVTDSEDVARLIASVSGGNRAGLP